MHFKSKYLQLDDFYNFLLELSKLERENEAVEIGILKKGLGLKLNCKDEVITLYFYPGHEASEISIMRNGMRYIYPRRLLKMKKHTLCDFINFLKKDERLYGCVPMIQWHINELIKNDYCDYISKQELS